MLHLHSLRCLALAIAVVSASAAPLYQRPVNADCVQLDGGSTDVVQLYPDQWRLGGDEDVTNSFETQARAICQVISHYRRRRCQADRMRWADLCSDLGLLYAASGCDRWRPHIGCAP